MALLSQANLHPWGIYVGENEGIDARPGTAVMRAAIEADDEIMSVDFGGVSEIDRAIADDGDAEWF
jgi:hypothetical protein